MGSTPGWGRSPGEGNGFPTSVLLPGEFHGQRSLVGCSPRVMNRRMCQGAWCPIDHIGGVFEVLERSADDFFSQLFSFKAVPMRDSINPRSLACLFFNSFGVFFFFLLQRLLVNWEKKTEMYKEIKYAFCNTLPLLSHNLYFSSVMFSFILGINYWCSQGSLQCLIEFSLKDTENQINNNNLKR